MESAAGSDARSAFVLTNQTTLQPVRPRSPGVLGQGLPRLGEVRIWRGAWAFPSAELRQRMSVAGRHLLGWSEATGRDRPREKRRQVDRAGTPWRTPPVTQHAGGVLVSGAPPRPTPTVLQERGGLLTAVWMAEAVTPCDEQSISRRWFCMLRCRAVAHIWQCWRLTTFLRLFRAGIGSNLWRW